MLGSSILLLGFLFSLYWSLRKTNWFDQGHARQIGYCAMLF
jgi:Tfp pilus assembly protein PilW